MNMFCTLFQSTSKKESLYFRKTSKMFKSKALCCPKFIQEKTSRTLKSWIKFMMRLSLNVIRTLRLKMMSGSYKKTLRISEFGDF